MKYYDVKEAQELAAQNKGFTLGEPGAGRKRFEDSFKLDVKGRGKSRKEKLALAETSSNLFNSDDEVVIIDPNGCAGEVEKRSK